ncbi:hypothetical protein LXA43DRAFT_671814 [Ganoderma leucocontextum]|nr:hypothetical protein LXA43DRAFT_671814 [Ganoderma leucocontextum]
MNSSAYSSTHTATNAHPYTSTDACYSATQSYYPFPDGPDEDCWSSVVAWARGEDVGLGAWPDADQVIFDASFAAKVASTTPSASCTLGPVQSPPCYYQEPSFLHRTAEAAQLRPHSFLDRCHSYPYSSYSTLSQALEQALPETTASCISPSLICSPPHHDSDLKDDCTSASTSQSSRASCRAAHRNPSSSPHPSPSPEPSPRTSSVVIASQRRNAPARTPAPVPAESWQCPYCPYVQRSRRSPDLKRHIKTHTRGADVADWVCCGVPVLNAVELGVPTTTVREAQTFDFDGVLMVGGCRKAFSRRDALIRHLQREKGKCFGDALSLHQRGNRESC